MNSSENCICDGIEGEPATTTFPDRLRNAEKEKDALVKAALISDKGFAGVFRCKKCSRLYVQQDFNLPDARWENVPTPLQGSED